MKKIHALIVDSLPPDQKLHRTLLRRLDAVRPRG